MRGNRLWVRLASLFVLLVLVVAAVPARAAGESPAPETSPAPAPETSHAPASDASPALAPVPVILIHGFGGSPETTWQAAISLFEAAGYRRGVTLFTVRLPSSVGDPLELFGDAGYVQGEMHRILRETGAAQADLVGHSRGGLIARILAAGESSSLVRRAVSIDAPHDGLLPQEAFIAMLAESGLPPQFTFLLPIPADLRSGSPALLTLKAREKRFSDRRSPALAVGSLWQEGSPAVLEGNDGVVQLASQHAWPGAETATFRLGPSPQALSTRPIPPEIIWQSPHSMSHDDHEVMGAVIRFLQVPSMAAPKSPCDGSPWPDLTGHWAAASIAPHLPERLPYQVTADGRCLFEPERPMTRAEFVYGLDRMKGLPERLQPSPFSDLVGHWSLGYVETARIAGLVQGLSTDRFGPDQPLTRAEAITLIARGLGLSPAEAQAAVVATGEGGAETALTGAAADPAVQGHWARGWIEAAADRGIIRGDERGFRPDDPVTCAEGAVILIRSLGSP